MRVPPVAEKEIFFLDKESKMRYIHCIKHNVIKYNNVDNRSERMDFMKIYDFTVEANDGAQVSLKDYEGKVLLVVNTATKCGFTPQYEGLEKLYDAYKDQGFVILDFPCNQFAFQAPGDDEKIDSFCKLRYDTKFPRFRKIKVNGREEAPLYTWLKSQKPGRIPWNFAKFLIDREGNVVERFAPTDKPEDLTEQIEALLRK